MRVLVCGDRIHRDLVAIAGTKAWVMEAGIGCVAYAVAWENHGRDAEPWQILDKGRPNLVVALPGLTAEMMRKVKAAEVPTCEPGA
jgi:hypothetical protein